jgi:hypothetical protein
MKIEDEELTNMLSFAATRRIAAVKILDVAVSGGK